MTETKLRKRKGNGSKSNPMKESSEIKDPKSKFGPFPKLSYHRLWSRTVIIIGILICIWYKSGKPDEINLVAQKDIVQKRGHSFVCDDYYWKEISSYPDCIPRNCGRFVLDKLVTGTEVDTLLKIAQRGFALGGSDGGASIFDIHSGVLSYKTKFINFFSLPEAKKILNPVDLTTYKLVKEKVQNAVAQTFGISPSALYLTKPTFFSKLSNVPPVTDHDEYWLPHVDKKTYESFHYTSLLYLSDYGTDFKGGRLIFIDGTAESSSMNVTIEPRKGRVAMFTSGAENLHFVERVTEGIRYAITIPFTCDEKMRISNNILEEKVDDFGEDDFENI